MNGRYYDTADKIIKQIDIAQTRLANYRARVDQLDREIKHAIHHENGNGIRWRVDDIEKYQRAITRLKNQRLPKLKSKLAQFQTLVLPGFGEQAVPVR